MRGTKGGMSGRKQELEAGAIDLSGRVALVTGGGRSIGATICLVLARAGADVAVNYHTSGAEARNICAKIEAMGRRAVAIRADVADVAQCEDLVREAEAAFGRVDILVSNSGTGQPHKIVDTTCAEWDRVMNVNARATFVLARKLLPGMMARRFGRFVTISSNIAVYGTGGGSFATYAASKAAMIAMTKGIAHEGAPYVTANAILPCMIRKYRDVEEERSEPIRIDEAQDLRWLGIPILARRRGEPEDVAHAVAFFASDAAEYVTGQSLHVSGGLFMP